MILGEERAAIISAQRQQWDRNSMWREIETQKQNVKFWKIFAAFGWCCFAVLFFVGIFAI